MGDKMSGKKCLANRSTVRPRGIWCRARTAQEIIVSHSWGCSKERGSEQRPESRQRRPTAVSAPKLLVVAQDGADEFDHAGGNSYEKPDYADPGGMQPAVQEGADKPSGDGAGGKHQGELAVAADLDPRVFLGAGATVFGRSRRWHGSRSGEAIVLYSSVKIGQTSFLVGPARWLSLCEPLMRQLRYGWVLGYDQGPVY